MSSLIAPTINLLILVGILFYYLREPLRTFVSTRHQTLKDELSNVREKLRASQERYEEFSAKLKAVEVEVANIQERARQEAEQSKGRIVGNARQVAGSILSEAKAQAEAVVSDCRDRLRVELGLRVAERSEGLIRDRLTGDDRARIRREFSRDVGSAQ